ncbi:MAG: DUF2937 family protein [Pseudomonadota bacterium]
MFLRTLTLVVTVCGGLLAAQFPAFSQQYAQRLGGAVDELARVVADFDASAQAAGLTRQAALAELRGTVFLERRQQDMRRSVGRLKTLRGDLEALKGAGPFMRAYYIGHLTDRDVVRRTLETFKPGLPVGTAGFSFFVLGWLAASGIVSLCARLLRRRPRTPRPA